MSDSPIGVKIISAIQGFISIVILIGGALVLYAAESHFNPANCTPGLLCSNSLNPDLGILFIILGLIGIGLAYGLWIGNYAVYVLNLAFLVIELMGLGYSLISGFSDSLALSALIDVIIFVYLLLPDTRDYFD